MTLQEWLIKAVRDELERTGRTQAGLAYLTGISTKHINMMLQGHVEGSLKAWDKVLTIMGISVQEAYERGFEDGLRELARRGSGQS